MRIRIWLRWILILVVVLFAAAAGFSRALRGAAARRYLIAHLETSFGRAVDVGQFNFSLLDGAQLEAHSVTVAEDPRFGNEYFLRAESLTAGLRWSALLAGRVEFGSVSLTRPSLNLVRDFQGRWNLEQWLPPTVSAGPPSGGAPRPPAGTLSPERLDVINIDGGRINFKQGTEKSEFALLDVSGSAEQESPGLWRLDLEATPMRVGAELQEIGTLRMRGSIGGASARLQPAELNVTWRDVSLADVLRLATHSDYGLRGTANLDLNAHIAPAASQKPDERGVRPVQWSVSAVAQLQGVHGWKLPPRDNDPAANIGMEAQWRLGEPQLMVSKLQIDMANSHVQGAGQVEWSHGLNPNLQIESSSVGLADVAAYYKALRVNVPQDLNVQGTLGVDATFAGWPPQLKQANIASDGGVLTASPLPAPLRIGPIHASVSRGTVNFASTELSFGPTGPKKGNNAAPESRTASTSDNSFALGGTISPDASGTYRWPPLWTFTIAGATPRIQDWDSLLPALGQPLSPGWAAAGGLSVSLQGARSAYSVPTKWNGTLNANGIVATVPFVNQPLRLLAARADFSPAQLSLTLSAAQAFGAMWHGTAARNTSGGPWKFDLSAGSLDVADLDLWLGPRARSGLLAELGLVSSGDSDLQIQERDAAVSGLSARGRLRVGEIALAPLKVDNFDGDVEVAGRSILVHKAQADFFGGKVNGMFDAMLFADPAYQFQGSFDQVDLARLARAVPSLSSRFSGVASATLNLTAHGVGRANLITSLEGAGQLDARDAQMRGVNLSSTLLAADPSAAPFVFASAKGSFRIKDGAIDAANIVLADSSRRFQAEGRIDFSRALTFQIRPIKPVAKSPDEASTGSFTLAGTVEAPRLSVLGAPGPTPETAAPRSARR